MSSPEFLSQVRPAEVLREAILRHIRYTLVRPTSELKPADYLKPVSLAIRDRIVDRMLETESRYRHKDSKRLYYLSMEFLMGRSLGDNLSNLRVEELCREVLAGFGVSLDEVLDSETDAGLGNGGLGRLAACFLESMATLGMPGFGYGIDYEFGLFRQEIFNGFQREKPDRWKVEWHAFPDRASRRSGQHPALRQSRGPARRRTQPRADVVRAQNRARHSDRHADRRLPRPDGELAATCSPPAPRKTSTSRSSTAATTFAPSSRRSSRKTSRAYCIPPTRS